MILTVNIGNTHITVGGYEQDTLIFCGRLHSDPAATVEEYAIRLVNLLQLYGVSPAQIEGGILGSVLAGNPDMAAGMARTLLGAMSQEQKDRLLVQLVTKNREKLLDKGNRAARDKGIGVQLCDVAVQKL